MIEKYLEICELLEKIGSGTPRLDAVLQKIKSPDFQYNSLERPEILTNTFLASSYWLDNELFDERHLYERDYDKTTSPIHLKLLEIGCALIDKGFPLEYYPEYYEQNGPYQLGGYVKTFMEQCHKRHAFLQEKAPQKIATHKIIHDHTDRKSHLK